MFVKRIVFVLLSLMMRLPIFAQDSLGKYFVHFQQTAIYQYHPAFNAKYSSDNSLNKEEESAISLTSTLFLDVPLGKHAKFTFNPELSGGKGLSSAKGLGGFTNGETFRIGNPEPVVYLARLFLENNWDFSHNQQVKVVLGKFGLADYFDFNTYAHDPRTHFLNWALMNAGAWDYAANTRGYTSGIYIGYSKPSFDLKFSFAAVPTSANGPVLDYQYDKAHGINLELTKSHSISEKVKTSYRLLLYHNQAGMGNYQLANLLANQLAKPDLMITRKDFRSKNGFSLNGELAYQEDWGIFGRYSWNDGKNETWAFTEIDESISLGMHFWGKLWKRKNDYAAIAWVRNGLSADHQRFQELGGMGFMIGDSALNYGGEHIIETFYQFEVNENIFLTPDYQFVINPGYNKDRGPVHVLSLRVHTEF